MSNAVEQTGGDYKVHAILTAKGLPLPNEIFRRAMERVSDPAVVEAIRETYSFAALRKVGLAEKKDFAFSAEEVAGKYENLHRFTKEGGNHPM